MRASLPCLPGCPCTCHGRTARQRPTPTGPTPAQVRRDLRAHGMRVLGRYPLLSVMRPGPVDALSADVVQVAPGRLISAQSHQTFAVVVVRVAMAGER